MKNSQHSHSIDLKRFYDQEAVRKIDENTLSLMKYRFSTMIKMISGKKLTILDIGAGDGDIILTLASQGHTCIAMDISDVRLKKYEESARKLNVKQIIGNVEERIPLDNASLDVVLCGEVIEHVPNNDKALSEISRVLKEGGQFIISVPYCETLKIAKCPDCGKTFELNGHLHTYDEKSLRQLLRQHRFKQIRKHIGHTKISRKVWQHWQSPLALQACNIIDVLTRALFRSSDTWIMMKGIRQA
jgi:ubiquinone/menaquinone biosynthesis C-methylase UbiE